jgi:hypothetical protein
LVLPTLKRSRDTARVVKTILTRTLCRLAVDNITLQVITIILTRIGQALDIPPRDGWTYYVLANGKVGDSDQKKGQGDQKAVFHEGLLVEGRKTQIGCSFSGILFRCFRDKTKDYM